MKLNKEADRTHFLMNALLGAFCASSLEVLEDSYPAC